MNIITVEKLRYVNYPVPEQKLLKYNNVNAFELTYMHLNLLETFKSDDV